MKTAKALLFMHELFRVADYVEADHPELATRLRSVRAPMTSAHPYGGVKLVVRADQIQIIDDALRAIGALPARLLFDWMR